MGFHERKRQRTEYYEKYVKGWKQRPCTACNGSGYYDHNNSPKCGGCDGTGKETYKPETQKEQKKRKFRCSQCEKVVESDYDIGGNYHNVVPSALCDGTGSLYEINT